MFRNGVQVGSCTGSPGVASPDPCVASRQTLADGDIKITILTSHASMWNLGFAAPEQVTIDIKPGDDANLIRLTTNPTRVAILSTPGFDASTKVAAGSLKFGRTGDEDSLKKLSNGKPTCNGGDINYDGRADLTCDFVTGSTRLSQTDGEGILKGKTVGNVPIEGRQGIVVLTK